MSRFLLNAILALLLAMAPAAGTSTRFLATRRVQTKARDFMDSDDGADEEEEDGADGQVTAFTPVSQAEQVEVNGDDVSEVDGGADSGVDEDEPEKPGDAPYAKPQFPALTPKQQGVKRQLRRIQVPPHRLTPLKASWIGIIEPLVEHMKLQVRMNTKRRAVEIRNSENTPDIGYLQKASDYIKAFMLGFDQSDAVALLRLDDLFVESFEVKDVKKLQGDHLARCIGRIAGKDGKTKYAIENATRTRISLCDSKIHILGSFANIRVARDSICSLILGS